MATRTDKFGNPYQLKLAQTKVSRRGGDVIDGVFRTFVKIGGASYGIEISNANKSDKNGNQGMWVKVTKYKPRPVNRNNGF